MTVYKGSWIHSIILISLISVPISLITFYLKGFGTSLAIFLILMVIPLVQLLFSTRVVQILINEKERNIEITTNKLFKVSRTKVQIKEMEISFFKAKERKGSKRPSLNIQSNQKDIIDLVAGVSGWKDSQLKDVYDNLINLKK